MNRLRKSRKGFSLVEMVLAIAIVMIIGGVVLGLCASISSMFIATYDIDDTADYALLYARGFENSFLKYTQISSDQVEDVSVTNRKWSWYVNDPAIETISSVPTLRVVFPNHTKGVDDSAVFTPDFMGNSSTAYKWNVWMFYRFNGGSSGNKTVEYIIFITENDPDSDFIYAYSGSFWLPRFDQRAEFQRVKDTRSVYVDGDEMTEDVLTGESYRYGFSDVQYEAIKGFVEGPENAGFKSQINFFWGGSES